jgi:predicted ArsR family transcriptional regulator
MSEIMRRRRQQRRDFLVTLYDRADGSVSEFVNAYEMGASLGINEAEARNIFEYLEEKGWVMVDDHRVGTIRLTAAGVDEVESAA